VPGKQNLQQITRYANMLSAMGPGCGSCSFCFCPKLLKCVVFIRDNLFESGNFFGMWSC
jgi:hypothetical protein